MDLITTITNICVIVGSLSGFCFLFQYIIHRLLNTEQFKAFDQTITQLSSSNFEAQLSAAILLRRFLIQNKKGNKKTLHDEAINVISALLRTLPTSVFQKTVGDGLAYAKDLTQVDLQRTNLQDVCIEGKTTKLIMKKCDLFMADLSYALIKNVDAEGAYFYHSILLRTVFKKSNLKEADFRNSDLTKSKFEDVELFMANFTGAINIPIEIQLGIEDYQEKDGSYSKRYMKTETITTNDDQSKGFIFFSIPGCTNTEDNVLIHEYQKMVENLGYDVIYYTRDQYPKFGQLNKIRLDIMQSSAMIVFGLKQIAIKKGVYRPGTDEENKFDNKWLNTPWNEIEVGLGAMKGIPILLVKDKEINNGIFDENLSESYIVTVPSSQKTTEVFESKAFKLWYSKINSINLNRLSENTDLIDFTADKQHKLWCCERLKEGWTYGKEKNNESKQHPYLTSFSELPECEKELYYKSWNDLLNIVDSYFY